MRGGGRYVRVWVYDANAAYLASTSNEGRTVNEALAAYSQMQTGNIALPVEYLKGTATSGLVTTTEASATPRGILGVTTRTHEYPKLVCDNGHLLNAVTDRCVGKMCEFAK